MGGAGTCVPLVVPPEAEVEVEVDVDVLVAPPEVLVEVEVLVSPPDVLLEVEVKPPEELELDEEDEDDELVRFEQYQASSPFQRTTQALSSVVSGRWEATRR